ncbi:mechanosensitive ion channel family protein [Haloferax mediterranei ATCC 33500]|nr:mechanosensitive ion channel family protein [Haloferax mediterranei]AHZ23341.1 mechanosensitive ion channel protein [Haloferax mediterranei ATCC 33500]ELZ99509.1 putative mechanosensitive ion channel [Haloferax mediterranei ATCC 33500]MDX5987285.1 mechanosensitive ion channel family protein [Haloferax mediterranei ATCC 33500]QCQ73806.1 mechanosensitive ion channel family protein [Haloferax mediterranei ATCC 33500]
MVLLQQGFALDPQQYVPQLVSAVTTVVLFVVVFAVIYLFGKSFVTRVVEEGLRRRDFDETIIGLAMSTTTVVTAVVAVALAATVAGFGVVLAAFATLGGALALAVGFAAQDLIANFVAGVFIIQDEPFTVGDWIEWNGNSGVVRDIQLRVTRLDTFDNELVTVPNSDLANAAVVNNVANDQRRVSVGFGIGYDDDIEQARDAIVEEGSRIEGVLDDPEPTAPVTELGDSAVVLSGRLWIDPDESSYGAVRAQFVEAVKERFDAEGIDMPYPNTELSGGVEVTNVGEGAGATSD